MLRIVFFCGGVLLAATLPALPPLWIIVVLGVFAGAVSVGVAVLRWPALVVLGLSYGLLAGHYLCNLQLPAGFEGRELLIRGHVSSIPMQREDSLRFEFLTDGAALDDGRDDASHQIPSKVMLTWYGRESLSVGEHWQLLVKLKRPRGFVNSGGFDYQRWLLSRHIGATGYVRTSTQNKPLAASRSFPLQRWRQHLRTWLLSHVANPDTRGPLLALALGDNSIISPQQWSLFKKTGTSHLMAISGLHIGLLALIGYAIGHGLRALLSLMLMRQRWIYPLPALLSVLLAFGYAALAGFGLPTQRALIMCVAANITLLIARSHSLWRAWSWALLGVLLWDPLAGYDAGFWLSFGAVAVLLWSFSYRHQRQSKGLLYRCWARCWMFGKAQVVLFVGLLVPLLALNLSPVLAAPLANAVAIPWVSFLVVVPLLSGLLLSAVHAGLAQWCLSVAETQLDLVWRWLDTVADLNLDTGALFASPIHTTVAIVVAVLGVALLLAPRGLPGRWLGALLVLPLLMPFTKASPPPLQLTVLDVGQGLATVVRTAHHTLVYDTGPRFSERFNAGDAIVGAYLQHQGLPDIDALVISHRDQDHAGGAGALSKSVLVHRWLLGETIRTAQPSDSEFCADAPPWHWDDVEFRFITTAAARFADDNNNRSCVLLISYGEQRILLPGDIEAEVERQLVAQRLLPAPVAVVVAPHHGSNTSSTRGFVEHLQPSAVIYSAGYRNRYHHPHPKVVSRYQKVGSEAFSTAEGGQIDVVWQADAKLTIRQRRLSHRRYWFAQ